MIYGPDGFLVGTRVDKRPPWLSMHGIVNLKRISRILPLHVGDCAFLSATNGGHFPRSSLKLTIPLLGQVLVQHGGKEAR